MGWVTPGLLIVVINTTKQTWTDRCYLPAPDAGDRSKLFRRFRCVSRDCFEQPVGSEKTGGQAEPFRFAHPRGPEPLEPYRECRVRPMPRRAREARQLGLAQCQATLDRSENLGAMPLSGVMAQAAHPA